MRTVLNAIFFLGLMVFCSKPSYAQPTERSQSESSKNLQAEQLVMSETNLDRTDEELREMENKILQQLTTGKPSAVQAASNSPEPKSSPSLEKVPKKEVIEAIEPPSVALDEEQLTLTKVSSNPSEKIIEKGLAKPEVEKKSPTPSTLDSLRSLETHPAIRSKNQGVARLLEPSKRSAGSTTDDSSTSKLLIAESQVKILTRELETTRQSLRSAERRIDELSELVHGTYAQSSSPKRDDGLMPELFEGDDVELPKAEDTSRAAYAPRPSYRDQPLSTTWNGASKAEIATVSAEHTPVRVGPNRNESTIFTLDRFHQVRVELRSGEWYRIITIGGSRGWVYGPALTFGNVDSDPNSSVRVRGYNPRYEKAGMAF